jgi:hypothetical protein
MQISIGLAGVLQDLPIRPRPALVLRADVRGPNFCRIIENAVEQAVRFDAAGVIASLRPEHREQCVANIRKLKTHCERWCLPLIVDVEGGLEHFREARELGADVIQADAMEAAETVPVLIRERSTVQYAEKWLACGAAGLVCGADLLLSPAGPKLTSIMLRLADISVSQTNHTSP